MDEFEKEAYDYAYQLHTKKDWPSVIVGAKYSILKSYARSGRMADEDFFDKLKERLLKYGTIGSKYEKSSIGCCAEVNATNPIYKKHASIALNAVTLSKAYRPRTMETIAKCKICKEIFIDDEL